MCAHAQVRYGAVMGTTAGVEAWALLLRVHAAVVPRLAKDLAGVGLPLAWYDVLLVLNSAPERRLRMTQLAEQAVLSRERISRVVAELEEAGLVTRERDVEDKRSRFAQITPAGRARLRGAAPTYLEGIERHFAAHLTGAEIEVITKALGRVLANA